MASALIHDVLIGNFHALLPGVILVGTLDNTQLLLGQDFVLSILLHPHQEHLCVLRNSQPAQGRNLGGRTANCFFVDDSPGEEVLTDLCHMLIGLHVIHTQFFHLLHHLVIPLAGTDSRLLTCAQDTVVIAPALDDHGDSGIQIRVPVNQRLNIAGAHAEGGPAAGVCRFDNAGAASGDAGIAHRHCKAGDLHGGIVHNLDEIDGSAQPLQFAPHIRNAFNRGILGPGMGADNDGVAALQGDHRILGGRHRRIGGRTQGGNHANGLCNLHQPLLFDVIDDPPALYAFELVPAVPGLITVLGNLVLIFAHAALFHRHPGKLLGVVVDHFADGPHHSINLLLGVFFKDLLRRTAAVDKGLHIFSRFHKHWSPFYQFDFAEPSAGTPAALSFIVTDLLLDFKESDPQ